MRIKVHDPAGGRTLEAQRSTPPALWQRFNDQIVIDVAQLPD
jgi:hypothetical protein